MSEFDMTDEQIQDLAKRLGMHVDPWSHGEGVREDGRWWVQVSRTRRVAYVWLAMPYTSPRGTRYVRYMCDIEMPLPVALAWLRVYERTPALARMMAAMWTVQANAMRKDLAARPVRSLRRWRKASRRHPMPPVGTLFQGASWWRDPARREAREATVAEHRRQRRARKRRARGWA